jgi:CDP-6-deoxy-D-xylo-4-hexulose-3-dehydrase
MKKLMNNLDKNGVEYRLGSAGGGNQLRQPYLKNLFSKTQAKKFKNTEHIHFYALYIGNYPELTKNNLNFIINLLNSVKK